MGIWSGPLTVVEGFQLSPQQKNLWLLRQKFIPEIFRIDGAILMEGRLDTVFLKAALLKVISRHQILRTVFAEQQSEPTQIVREATLHFDVERRALDNKSLSAKLDEVFARFCETIPFRKNFPTFRLSLVKLDPESHVLLVGLPALCGDAESLGVLFDEITAAYRSCVENRAMGDEPMQYADYGAWQTEVLEDEEARQFWVNQNVPAPQAWPLPLARETTERFVPGSISTDLPVRAGDLRGLNSDFPALFLSVWQMLLSRFAGGAEVWTGVGVDGRKYSKLKNAVGPYSQYLPVRCPSPKLSAREYLQQSRRGYAKAVEKRDSFAWEFVGKGPGFTPVMFDYKEERSHTIDIPPVHFSLARTSACGEPFALELSVQPKEKAFLATVRFDRSRYHEADARLILTGFVTLVNEVVQHPDRNVSAFTSE